MASGRPKDIFYISQAILTPDADAIVTNFFGSLYSWQSSTLPLVDDWVMKQSTDVEHGINIVIKDFVDSNFTKTVIQKNLE